MSPKPHDNIFIRGEGTPKDTQGRKSCEMEPKIGVRLHKSRNIRNYQKPEETQKNLP